MVTGVCAEGSLQKGFSEHLCIMVKRSGVAFNVKCFFYVHVIPIGIKQGSCHLSCSVLWFCASLAEDSGFPGDELNTETQLCVCWRKGWACSIFAKCFPRLAGAVLTKTVPLKRQRQTGSCLPRHLTATAVPPCSTWTFLLGAVEGREAQPPWQANTCNTLQRTDVVHQGPGFCLMGQSEETIEPLNHNTFLHHLR